MAAAFDSVDALQPSKALSVSFSITNSEIKCHFLLITTLCFVFKRDFDLSTQEAEARGLWIWDQPGLEESSGKSEIESKISSLKHNRNKKQTNRECVGLYYIAIDK